MNSLLTIPFLLGPAALIAVNADETPVAPEKNIVETAVSAGSFNTLAAALTAADLVDALQGDGPYTVFAPTDEAFAALPKEAVEALLQPQNQEVLQAVLLRHVVQGQVTAFQAIGVDAQPLAGDRLPIRLTQDHDGQRSLSVAGINISKADQILGNAIVHQIDAVILPENLSTLLRPKLPPVRAFLEEVIAQGVPQYNGGDIAGCAARYQQALEALLLLEQLPDQQATAVRRALQQAEGRSERDVAWTLRAAIDRIRLDFEREV